MTREEAEATATALVTVEEESWAHDGASRVEWRVCIGGRMVDEIRANGEQPYMDAAKASADAMADVWRDAIVRTLVGE